MQEAYNYISVINDEINKQIELARLRAEALRASQQTKPETTSIIDKTRENLKGLTDRLMGIIGN